MENTLENMSRLERLPLELVYEIFNITPPEVLIKLRAASRTLKHYVSKYSMLIDMPTVHSVQVCGPSAFSPSSHIKIMIIIPHSENKKFELGLACKLPIGLLEDIRKDSIREFDSEEYSLCFDPQYDCISALECLSRCLGTHIKSIELRNNIGQTVSAIFNGKNIEKLTLFGEKLSCETANAFLQMCSSNNVAHLDMHVIGFANNDPGKVLLNLASHVPSLRIVHNNEWMINKDQCDGQCLFGIPDIDWAPIILGMFERKIEKLCITNQWKFGYLSRERADWLIEKLTLLKKKFWFETSCNQYIGDPNYELNGCTIKIEEIDDNKRLRNRRLAISNRNDIPLFNSSFLPMFQ